MPEGFPVIRGVDADELRSGLDDGSITLIDVREAHEFAQGTIPGALSMPLSGFDPAELPLAGGARVVFSCAAGVRSMHALAICQEAGIDLTEHFPAGFKGWVAAGGPIERP